MWLDIILVYSLSVYCVVLFAIIAFFCWKLYRIQKSIKSIINKNYETVEGMKAEMSFIFSAEFED